jgi:hypothetical protein
VVLVVEVLVVVGAADDDVLAPAPVILEAGCLAAE